MDIKPVKVKGFTYGKHFIFYCTPCNKFHRHGAVTPTGRHGTNYGHRVAHCSIDTAASYKEIGYFLQEYNKNEFLEMEQWITGMLAKYKKPRASASKRP